MKISNFISLLGVAFIATITLEAQETITISTPRISKALVEKWAQEYNAQHSDRQVKTLVGANAKGADLQVTTQTEKSGATVARYAVLPITSSQNPTLRNLTRRALNKKRLEQLFFVDEDEEETSISGNNIFARQTIYTGSIRSSSAQGFALSFGHTRSDYRGKRIAGDDYYLLNALEEDPQSVTINGLPYLYDLESRKLRSDIVVLPLDLDDDHAEVIASGELDSTLDLLETSTVKLVPINLLSVIDLTHNPLAQDFLAWIQKQGQQQNHHYGFLKIESNEHSLLADR